MSQKQYLEFLSDSRRNNIQYIICLEKLSNNNTLINKIKELTKIPYDISLLSTAYKIAGEGSNFHSRDNFPQHRLLTIDLIFMTGLQICFKFC